MPCRAQDILPLRPSGSYTPVTIRSHRASGTSCWEPHSCVSPHLLRAKPESLTSRPGVHLVPPPAAGLLGSPESRRLCAQCSSDSAQCVRAVGTVCGIPGGSQLTHSVNRMRSLLLPGHDRHAVQRLHSLSLTCQAWSCPEIPSLSPSPQLSTSSCFLRQGLSKPRFIC